jgi:hypothetical protein
MDNWKIKDMIRSGYITYNVGDVVRIWKRKRNGYSHSIEDGIDYTIGIVDVDKIIKKHSSQ